MSGIMPLINVPDTVQYGRIQAHLVAFIADTKNDDDQIPDEIPLEGVVVLTPTVGVIRFPTTAPPRTAVVQALRCPIIGGDLYPPDTPLEGPLPDTPGVVVVASDQPVGLPDTVQWTATFELVGARVQPGSVTFEVPSGGVVDLTTVIPATPGPGTVVVVSAVDRERAEDAAAAAAGSATDADRSRSEATSSAAAAAGSAGSAFDDAAIAQGARLGAEAAAATATQKASAAASSATAAQTAAALIGLQDTGWRDVSAALHADCTGTLLVRRIGARVTARFVDIKSVGATSVHMRMWYIPVGLRPTRPYDAPIGVVPYGSLPRGFSSLVVGPIGWNLLLEARRTTALTTEDLLVGELSWLTNDAFPTPAAYPGTPA